MVDIQSPTAEIRRGKKRRKKKEERRRNRMKIYMVSLLHRATIKYIWSALLHRATIKEEELECGPVPNVMAALQM